MKNCDFVYILFAIGYDFSDIYGAYGNVCDIFDFDDNNNNDNNNNKQKETK